MRFAPLSLAAATALGCAPVSDTATGSWEDWTARSTPTVLEHSTGAPGIRIQRAIGTAGDETAYDLWATRDGGYVITGSAQSEHDDLDLVVLEVDGEGELYWARTFGGPELEIGFGVRELGDGTIVVAGWTRSFGSGARDILFFVTDE